MVSHMAHSPRVTASVDERTLKALQLYAAANDQSLSAAVRDLLKAMAPSLVQAARTIEYGRQLEGTAREGLASAIDDVIARYEDAAVAATALFDLPPVDLPPEV